MHTTPPRFAGHAHSGPVCQRLLRHAAHAAALCLLIGLLLAAMSGWRHTGAKLSYSFAIGMQCWLYIDGGRALIAQLLHRRYPDDAECANGWPGWAWMAFCVLLGAALGYTLGVLLGDWLTGQRSIYWWEASWGSIASTAMFTLTMASLTTGYFYTRGRLLAAQAQAEQARRVAAETQLKLLETQLEPHMLFNTLANLRVLIGLDPARAQAMLDQLITFLRATLNASRSGSHSLKDEFARLADYLQLMQVRMGARLQPELSLPAELQALQIPPLLLQPLVENAIKHGLEPHIEGGHLRVAAALQGQVLLLSVSDDGAGLNAQGTTAGTRFGLQQVRERLLARYGQQAGLSISAPEAGGCRVEISIPLQEAQAQSTSV